MKTKNLLILCVCLLASLSLSAQSITVTGTITDSNKHPISHACIVTKGTTNVVTSDKNGKYRISTTIGATLVFSIIGYETRKMKVESDELDIILLLDKTITDEYVFTTDLPRKKISSKAKDSITEKDN